VIRICGESTFGHRALAGEGAGHAAPRMGFAGRLRSPSGAIPVNDDPLARPQDAVAMPGHRRGRRAELFRDNFRLKS